MRKQRSARLLCGEDLGVLEFDAMQGVPVVPKSSERQGKSGLIEGGLRTCRAVGLQLPCALDPMAAVAVSAVCLTPAKVGGGAR